MIQSIGKKKRREKKRGGEGPESSIHRRISHHRPQNTNDRSLALTISHCMSVRRIDQPANQPASEGEGVTISRDRTETETEYRSFGQVFYLFFFYNFSPHTYGVHSIHPSPSSPG